MDILPQPKLNIGQTIGVFCSGWYVESEKLTASTTYLETAGFDIYLHPETELRDGQMGGSAQDRVNAFHDLLKDDTVHVIMAARGGYGTMQWLHLVDWDLVRSVNKPLIGFSDSTALLNAAYTQAGVCGYHGPLLWWPTGWKDPHMLQSMVDVCAGASEISLGGEPRRLGKAKGRLFGGNATVLMHQIGTQYLPQQKEDVILFLEDAYELHNDFDRYLWHFKHAGVFDRWNVTGLILGQFYNIGDNTIPFGKDTEEIFREFFLDIPMVEKANFGHGEHMITLPYAREVELTVDQSPKVTVL